MGKILKWIGIGFGALVVLVVILAIVGGEDDEGTTTTSTANEGDNVAATAPAESTENGTDENGTEASGSSPAEIGVTQKVGDAEVTVHGFRMATDSVLPPDPGNVYIIIDVSMRNTGDNPYNLSSLLQTGLRDGEGRNYSLTIGADTETQFDGTTAPGDILRGEVAFEVPEDSEGLVFIFEQTFGSGQAFWAIE